MIQNMPNYANDYEFIVARFIDGEYWFWGAYTNVCEANKTAADIDGVVFHNVRIQGKRG